MAEGVGAQKVPLVFFRTDAGREPVREWLKGLDESERHAIGKDLLRAQWRWPVGMPLCRPWEGVYGKCERTCPATARRASSFRSTGLISWRCTVSSRKRELPRKTT
jgi:hypothetical protein